MTELFLKKYSINSEYKDFFSEKIIHEIEDFLNTQKNITPEIKNIFLALSTPISKAKVLILGQDPYFQENVATGLAFEVEKESWLDDKINSSLKNILKLIYKSYTNQSKSIEQIRQDIENGDFLIETPKNLFKTYAKNGVILLNTSLTTEIGSANAHSKFWNDITTNLLSYIYSKNKNIIFISWGNFSKNVLEKAGIPDTNIVSSNHPAIAGKNDENDFLNGTTVIDTMHLINWLGIDFAPKYVSLINEIKHHNKLYYEQNTSEISDKEYDMLLKELNDISKKYNLTNTVISNVGGSTNEKFEKVTHKEKMLSLENTYSIEDLSDFNLRVNKIIKEFPEYFVELKIDGISISLIYEKGNLSKAITRGNGSVGEDVTNNVLEISSIPKTLNEKIDIEVRGEIVMPFSSFNKINEKRKKENEPLLANPRNAAAGTMRQLDSSVVKERELDCYLYYIINPLKYNIKTQQEAFNYLDKLRFKTTKISYLISDIQKMKEIIDETKILKEKLDYATDGLVIKVNDFKYYEILSSTNKSPRWAIAYKFDTEKVVTRVLSVSYQVGKTGAITPVANLEEVEISGSKVKRASLHNFLNIKNKDIRINDYVLVEKAAEIIPYILKSLPDMRTNNVYEIQMPTHCPSCNELLDLDPKKLTLKCENIDCPEKIITRLSFFVSKKGMSISSIGDENIRTFTDKGLVKNFEDFYFLKDKKNVLLSLPLFKEKKVNNILQNIAFSKLNSFSNILSSMSIPNVSLSTLDLILQEFSSLEKLKSATLDDLTNIKGVGEKNAKSIIEFLQNDKNIHTFETFKSLNMRLDMDKKISVELKNKISKLNYNKEVLTLFETPFNFKDKKVRIDNTNDLTYDEAKEFLEFFGYEIDKTSTNSFTENNEITVIKEILGLN